MDLCLHPDRPAGQASDLWAASASRALHPSRAQVGGDWLWAVASGLATVTVPWELRDEPDPDHAGELVLATEQYEAWVLTWSPGATGDWHDHAGPGAFCVVSGTLDEVRATPAGRRETRSFAPGAGTVFAAGDRHRLANRAGAVATTLHVYTRH